MLPIASINSMAVSLPDLYCADAMATERLPGHVLMLGRVVWDNGRMIFVFPQQDAQGELSQIPIDDAGIIGSEDYASMAMTGPTPMDSYVVAQVFLGEDENQAPAVTCLSNPLPVARLNPGIYGAYYKWLTPDFFVKSFGYKKYRNWNWRDRWGDRFRKVREEYRKDRGRGYHERIRKMRHHGEHKRPLQKAIDEKKRDLTNKIPEKIQNIKPAIVNKPAGAVHGNKKPIVLPNS